MRPSDEERGGCQVALSTDPADRQAFQNLSPGVSNSPGAARRLGIVDEHPFTRECISSCLGLVRPDLSVLTFSKIEECITASDANFDLVLFHLHGCGAEGSDQTIATLKSVFRLFPVIILSDIDNSNWVMEALESGARGYIPTGSTSVAVAVEVIRLVSAGGTFVPLTSLQTIQHAALLSGPLSPRQLAVLHQIRQGKSNKIIAHELGMSESTVKVHVRGIMKKLHATNRTEAVFRARTLYSARPQLLASPGHSIRRNGGVK